MRSQWVDKATGKVINLSNFSFSEMSGWNGYEYDYTTWHKAQGTNYDLSVLTVSKTVVSVRGILSEGKQAAGVYINGVQKGETVHIHIRVNGLKNGQYLRIANEISQEGDRQITEDGVADITLTSNGTSYGNVYMLVYGAGELDVTIEQLPLYPGALVSDGVDDYGRTAEAISDEVGTMLIHGEFIIKNDNYQILLCTAPIDNNGSTLIVRNSQDATLILGKPETKTTGKIACLSRTPGAPSLAINIFNNANGSYHKGVLYRIILIKEQLDDAAVEFLKWKVDKEHRDWLKEKGWAA